MFVDFYPDFKEFEVLLTKHIEYIVCLALHGGISTAP